ncbi:MAG: hypothetical protein QF664_14250 [Dehalococcoidia bacterium]|nr:hypothetical protein [Dehalococcoidia bacterium]
MAVLPYVASATPIASRNTQGGGDCALCATAQACEQHPNPWLLDKAELVPVAFKAIQELVRRLERLEATP